MEAKTVSGFSALALDHAERPRNRCLPSRYNAHARITGPCGDTMEFWLAVKDGVAQNAWFDTDGCRSSLACGSMATCLATGKPIETCAAIAQNDILRALGGVPEQGEHCALLAANTLRAACEDYSVHIATENR